MTNTTIATANQAATLARYPHAVAVHTPARGGWVVWSAAPERMDVCGGALTKPEPTEADAWRVSAELAASITPARPHMTIAQVQATIRAIGATCGRTEHGEYRVSLPGLSAERAEAIAAYTEDADEAIAAAEAATGRTAPRDWAIACRLSGSLTYKAREGRRPGFPSRFTATAENATPDGSKMRARVEFPAQADGGATCPRWSVSRTINLPASISESADRVAVRAAIEAAIERMGVGAWDVAIAFDAEA